MMPLQIWSETRSIEKDGVFVGYGAGWSFFRHNLTGHRVDDLPPGRGAAAAMMLASNGSSTASAAWEARVRSPPPVDAALLLFMALIADEACLVTRLVT